jgi:hypothetical protein
VVWNYSGTRLEKITNGTPNKGPIPGDVLSYDGPTSYGHTSVVSAANIDGNGNGSITIIEQNYSPNGSRTHNVSNWYVQSSEGVSGWLHDGQTGGACSAPTLNSPSDGQVLSSRTVTFSWQGLSGCAFNGYTFRIKNVSNMDSGGTTIIDTGEGSTQRTETITGWDNQDLYWGVRAANAPNGASWAIRRFRIEPGSGGILWAANYYDDHTRWWDNNNSSDWRCSETLDGQALDKNYGSGAPCGGIFGDIWVGDYSARITFGPANYVFRIEHDDGLKVWLDNQNIADRGESGSSYICPARYISGDKDLRVMLREDWGDAKVKVTWTTDARVCNPPAHTHFLPMLIR